MDSTDISGTGENMGVPPSSAGQMLTAQRQVSFKGRVCSTQRQACLCLVTQLCTTLCNPMDCIPSGSSVHGDSLGKNTRVGCYALFQGIFPTQRSNLGLPHCRWILYSLSHQGSPTVAGVPG